MKELIAFIVGNLVEDREAVEVREIADGKVEIYQVMVAPMDRGTVIGKQGRTIRAVRSLVSAAAARQSRRAVVEVMEQG